MLSISIIQGLNSFLSNIQIHHTLLLHFTSIHIPITNSLVHSFFNITSWPFNNAISFLALATCSKKLKHQSQTNKKTHNMHSTIIVSISFLYGHTHPWKKTPATFHLVIKSWCKCLQTLNHFSFTSLHPWSMSRLKSPFHIESIILYRTTSFWVTYVTPPL